MKIISFILYFTVSPLSIILNTQMCITKQKMQGFFLSSDKDQQIKVPEKAKGFRRKSLKAVESKMVKFILKPDELSIAGEDGQAVCPAGKLIISVGGSQPGMRIKTASIVLQQIITNN